MAWYYVTRCYCSQCREANEEGYAIKLIDETGSNIEHLVRIREIEVVQEFSNHKEAEELGEVLAKLENTRFFMN